MREIVGYICAGILVLVVLSAAIIGVGYLIWKSFMFETFYLQDRIDQRNARLSLATLLFVTAVLGMIWGLGLT